MELTLNAPSSLIVSRDETVDPITESKMKKSAKAALKKTPISNALNNSKKRKSQSIKFSSEDKVYGKDFILYLEFFKKINV
ncbi:MAG: hypothetical protein MHPSP_002791 [Paramarteilia canceri]